MNCAEKLLEPTIFFMNGKIGKVDNGSSILSGLVVKLYNSK